MTDVDHKSNLMQVDLVPKTLPRLFCTSISTNHLSNILAYYSRRCDGEVCLRGQHERNAHIKESCSDNRCIEMAYPHRIQLRNPRNRSVF